MNFPEALIEADRQARADGQPRFVATSDAFVYHVSTNRPTFMGSYVVLGDGVFRFWARSANFPSGHSRNIAEYLRARPVDAR